MKSAPALISSQAKVFLSADMVAQVEYSASYTRIPRTGMALKWWGENIQNVDCALSGGSLLFLSAKSDKATATIVSSNPEKEVSVRVTYSLRLSHWSELLTAYRFRRHNMPKAVATIVSNVTPLLPLAAAPDSLVTVSTDSPELCFLGPQHVGRAANDSDQTTTFSYYEGITPFTILVGRFARHALEGEVAVFQAPDAVTRSKEFAEEVASAGQVVRAYFHRLLGDPAIIHRGILVVDSAAAFSMGSTVAINPNQLRPSPWNDTARVSLLRDLAHEYAHSWWNFSSAWANPDDRALVNEALAILLSYDALREITGQRKSPDRDKEIWEHASYALRRTMRALRRDADTSSGAYAAALLIDLSTRQRATVLDAVRTLWQHARTNSLSINNLRDIFNRTAGSPLGDVVADGVRYPKPPVASVRVNYAPSRKQWEISLTPQISRRKQLWRRLVAAGLCLSPCSNIGRTLTLPTGSESEAVRLLYILEPFHVMFRRSVRLLTLHRSPTLKKLWNWASRSWPDVNGNDGSVGFPARMAGLVCSLLALLLNPHDPVGWQNLSRVIDPLSSALSDKFRSAAARRAIYGPEGSLRAVLAGQQTRNAAEVDQRSGPGSSPFRRTDASAKD